MPHNSFKQEKEQSIMYSAVRRVICCRVGYFLPPAMEIQFNMQWICAPVHFVQLTVQGDELIFQLIRWEETHIGPLMCFIISAKQSPPWDRYCVLQRDNWWALVLQLLSSEIALSDAGMKAESSVYIPVDMQLLCFIMANFGQLC